MPYISITGLELKRPWHVFRFYRHAAPSLRQAKRSKGNLRTEVKTISGVHHTLTVWESREAMRAFLICGPHKKAMKVFPAIATGKTFGYDSDKIPDWDEVHRLWQEHGQSYAA